MELPVDNRHTVLKSVSFKCTLIRGLAQKNPCYYTLQEVSPRMVESSCSAQSQGIHLCFCVSECQAAKSLSFFFWIPKRNHYKVFVKIIQTNKILLENFSLDRCSNNFVREVGYDSISFKCVIETLTNDFIAPLEVSF